MKSVWRKHLIICLVLGLLAIPIYFLDRALLGPTGGNWIMLDFRGLIFWSYVTLVAVHVTLSSIAVLLFPKAGTLRIHVGSMVLSVVLLITGVAVYGKVRRMAMSNHYQALTQSRRPLMNVIELTEWSYFPDKNHPTEIRVSVVVHQSGRFAGNVTGQQTDASGSSTTLFESTNQAESQRQVRSGEAFTYAFPLKFLTTGRGRRRAHYIISFQGFERTCSRRHCKSLHEIAAAGRRRRQLLLCATATFSTWNGSERASCKMS
jgi:hypothetical protein